MIAKKHTRMLRPSFRV